MPDLPFYYIFHKFSFTALLIAGLTRYIVSIKKHGGRGRGPSVQIFELVSKCSEETKENSWTDLIQIDLNNLVVLAALVWHQQVTVFISKSCNLWKRQNT